MRHKRPGLAPRRAEGGFTFTETIVVIAVITAMSAAAMVFFFGRYDLTRRHAVTAQLAEAIQTVQVLPAGNPWTWEVAAQKVLADVMDAAPPTASSPNGTRSDSLPGGLHAGRTLVTDQALMRDARGALVTIAGCAIGDLQVTVHPARLPPENELQEAEAQWLKSKLEIGLPQLIVTVQEEALFCCLPGP